MIFKKEQKEKNKSSKTEMDLDTFKQYESPIVNDVLGFSSNFFISSYSENTVVKSPESVFRGAIFSKNRFLSEEYLLNFRKNESDLAMGMGVMNFQEPSVLQAMALRKYKEDPKHLIQLPDYTPIKASIDAVFRSRRSVRKYSSREMSLEELSTILFYGQGISGGFKFDGAPETASMGPDNAEIQWRMAPSGGSLYPVDLYFFSSNVRELDNGIYKYIPEHHGLKSIRTLEKDFDLNNVAQIQDLDYKNANLFFVFVYKLYENTRKYGDSGLAFAFIEAGEISENIHLACTAMGCGPCDIGGYLKHELEKSIELDGLTQHVIHTMLVGC